MPQHRPGASPHPLPGGLLGEALPPVLLALTRDARAPAPPIKLSQQAHHNQPPGCPKAPSVAGGPQGVYRAAVRAAIALHPECFDPAVEVTRHEPVSPYPRTPAPWTSLRSGPGVSFPKLPQTVEIYLRIEYQRGVQFSGGVPGSVGTEWSGHPLLFWSLQCEKFCFLSSLS